MKASLLHILSPLLLFLSFPGAARTAPAGAAPAEGTQEYLFKVGQFDKLKVSDNVRVVYRCVPDSSGFVSYRGDTDFEDAFILTNNKGTLQIQVTTEDVGKPGLPVVYCYSDFLSSVENASDFDVIIESPSPCSSFKASQMGNGRVIVDGIKATRVTGVLLAGNGSVVLQGKCNEATLKMVGAGIIAADRLNAQKVTCKILGGGHISCWPGEDLHVSGIGSTKIYYKGNPAIKKTGGGKIIPLPAGGMPVATD